MTQEVKDRLCDAVCRLERREWPDCLGREPDVCRIMTDSEYLHNVTDPFYIALCDLLGNPRELAKFDVDYYRKVTDGGMSEPDFFREWLEEEGIIRRASIFP